MENNLDSVKEEENVTPLQEETAEEVVSKVSDTEPEDKQEAPDELALLKAKYDALNDTHLRMAAEYDNFRKRSQREREHVHADAVTYAVKAMLPTFDNLERALKAETADEEYKKGVELTMTQLIESLKSIGVEKINAEPGAAFDPNEHDAVMHIENEELGENVIAEAYQQGFSVGGKVIRHAMVQVAN